MNAPIVQLVIEPGREKVEHFTANIAVVFGSGDTKRLTPGEAAALRDRLAVALTAYETIYDTYTPESAT